MSFQCDFGRSWNISHMAFDWPFKMIESHQLYGMFVNIDADNILAITVYDKHAITNANHIIDDMQICDIPISDIPIRQIIVGSYISFVTVEIRLLQYCKPEQFVLIL